jgi:hypothetical protein
MNFGNVARVLTITAACFAAVGSATSNTNNGPAAQQQSQINSPPAPQQMDPSRALGVWHSTFGAVKIGADDAHGGIQAGAIQGIWMYQRQGQDVIGYFYGTLQGNVLRFRWNEPGNPPLNGEGYIAFNQVGSQYSGRWWSDKKDRVGDWNGYRQATDSPQPYGGQNAQYGGSQYGGQPQQQPYPPQGQYPQQQPYPPQGQYPQQYPPQQQPYPPQGQYPQQQYPQQPQYPQQQYPQQPQQPQYPQQQQPYPPQQQPYYPQGQRT